MGERWISAEDWRYSRKYMAREDEAAELSEEAAVVDGIRRKATEALGKFYAALKPYRSGAVTASVVSMALGGLLDELRVDEQVATWTRCRASRRPHEAADHRGIKAGWMGSQTGGWCWDRQADRNLFSTHRCRTEDVRLSAIPVAGSGASH